MKWVLITLLLIFAGWRAAIFLVKRGEKNTSIAVVDTSIVTTPAPDTTKKDSVKTPEGNLDTIPKNRVALPAGSINTFDIKPQQIVDYAKTLIGVPYVYGSTDPAKGFDCSGFITYVFKKFNITVPRSSIDFTNVGIEVSASAAKPGDIILFTGTDSTERFVGHMGIVVENSSELKFIHSTSGKMHGVTITPLSDYYKGRYVKTLRIFP